MFNTIFPLCLMRQACRLSARGFYDPKTASLPPTVVNAPVSAQVYCGARPLARVVVLGACNRGMLANQHVYLNDLGELVVPG